MNNDSPILYILIGDLQRVLCVPISDFSAIDV